MVKPTTQTIIMPLLHGDLSPDGFYLWATQYYQCKQGLKLNGSFSPVPYFLLCRAIELGIKSILLRESTRDIVKRKFNHHLVQAYEALPEKHQSLDHQELKVLRQANEIHYKPKGFEYFAPENALIGYSNFPDLAILDNIATKLLANPTQTGE